MGRLHDSGLGMRAWYLTASMRVWPSAISAVKRHDIDGLAAKIQQELSLKEDSGNAARAS